MQENNFLKMPVRYFKGVGPRKGEALTSLGVETARDLLWYLPARYEDRSNFTAIRDLKPGEHQTVRGEVVTIISRVSKSGMPVFQMALTDGRGCVHAVWFNQPYLKDYFKKGTNVILYGRVERYDRLQIVQPEYEVMEGDEAGSGNVGRGVPGYPLTGRLTQRYMRGLVRTILSKYVKSLAESLPTYMLAREKLVDIRFAIRNIHFPTTFDILEKAYRRIVFEEFLTLQLALALKRKDARAERPGLSHG